MAQSVIFTATNAFPNSKPVAKRGKERVLAGKLNVRCPKGGIPQSSTPCSLPYLFADNYANLAHTIDRVSKMTNTPLGGTHFGRSHLSPGDLIGAKRIKFREISTFSSSLWLIS
jgi:hypothetical protein